METLLLIGITGLAGYYFANKNDNLGNENIRNISENDPLPNTMPEIEKPPSMNIYNSKITEAANNKVLELSTKNYNDSTLPSVSGVLPPLYNSYSAIGNESINKGHINELTWKQQSDINSINRYSDINTGVQPDIINRPMFNSVYDTTIQKGEYSNFNKEQNKSQQISLLTGTPLELEHTNMVPFFGSNVKQNVETFTNESKLDNFTGLSSTFIHKKEPEQRFSDYLNIPEIGINGTTRTPAVFDVIDQSRFIPSSFKQNEKPFYEERVAAPISFTIDNPITNAQIDQPTINDLRVKNKPQISYEAKINAGSKLVPASETIGVVSKNRIDSSFELGPSRLFTGPAINTTPMLPENYNNILPTSRQNQNLEYFGGSKSTNSFAQTQRIAIDNSNELSFN